MTLKAYVFRRPTRGAYVVFAENRMDAALTLKDERVDGYEDVSSDLVEYEIAPRLVIDTEVKYP